MITARDAKMKVQEEILAEPDARWGMKSEAARVKLFATPDDAPWPPVTTPIGAPLDTIIDINHDNGFNVPKLLAANICAVVHKVGQGTTFHDPLYQSRRMAAKAAGMLWGGYLFNSSEDPAAQARDFINTAHFSNDELMSFDWEQIGKNITLSQAHVFIQTIFDLTGRYPMIYGSNVCREAIGDKADALLAKCAYWHVIYRETPDLIPKQVWPNYDLWQYLDGGKSGVPGSDGADRNKFQGTEAELRVAWPNFPRKA